MVAEDVCQDSAVVGVVMSEKDDGGPAFPRAGCELPNYQYIDQGEAGMTLRDYFAAAALQGMLATNIRQPKNITVPEMAQAIAAGAYAMADAMLKAREESGNG
ncbi:MAG: hypothetical protein AB7F35_29715 [Acetobacteraceae bacterium]